METEHTDAVWVDEHLKLSCAELASYCGLSEAELRELVDYGALMPCDMRDAEWTFSGDIAVTVRAAGRLRDELELDAHESALLADTRDDAVLRAPEAGSGPRTVQPFP